jgi:hypothetical protein
MLRSHHTRVRVASLCDRRRALNLPSKLTEWRTDTTAVEFDETSTAALQATRTCACALVRHIALVRSMRYLVRGRGRCRHKCGAGRVLRRCGPLPGYSGVSPACASGLGPSCTAPSPAGRHHRAAASATPLQGALAEYSRRARGLIGLVGAEGFEPPTLCSQSRCATRLRHAPTGFPSYQAHALPFTPGKSLF